MCYAGSNPATPRQFTITRQMYRAYDTCRYGVEWHDMPLSENDLQRALITWAKTQIPKYPCLLWLHHVPNGGKRDSREAMTLKQSGVTPGILDLALDVAKGGYHGLRIELKKPGGKCAKPSDEQTEYMAFLTEQGYANIISNDFAEVKAFIVDYLEGKVIR